MTNIAVAFSETRTTVGFYLHMPRALFVDGVTRHDNSYVTARMRGLVKVTVLTDGRVSFRDLGPTGTGVTVYATSVNFGGDDYTAERFASLYADYIANQNQG